MKIGLLRVSIQVPESGSLKHKRRYLQSLKSQIRSKFNVSVAEVDSHDLWQRIDLAVALVSTDGAHIDQVFDAVMTLVDAQADLQIIEECREML